MPDGAQPEPWLRDTLKDVPPVQRAVLHALELADEDVERWCGGLTDEEINIRPSGLPSLAFHLRHIARSLDRLLTYAEGKAITAEQLAALIAEADLGAIRSELMSEIKQAIRKSSERIRAFSVSDLDEVRKVGKRGLPTTVAGLLVHVADHTQRHVGQAITTAKLISGLRSG